MQRRTKIIVGTFVALTALGLIGRATGLADSPAPVASPAPAASAPAQPAGSSAPAAPPASEPATTTEQLGAWWADVKADHEAFTEHLRAFDFRPGQLSQLRDDVRALRGHGPIPVPSIDAPWQKALDSYDRGFILAQAGELKAGTDALNEANGYVGEVTTALSAQL